MLFISLENWDDIWRRNQFICAELAGRFPEMHILFVAPPRDVSNAIRTRNWAGLRGGKPWHPAGLPNITVIRPLKFFPNTIPPLRLLNEWLIRVQIRRAAATATEATTTTDFHHKDTKAQRTTTTLEAETGLADQPAGRDYDCDGDGHGGSPQRTRRNAEAGEREKATEATTTDFHHKDTKAQRREDTNLATENGASPVNQREILWINAHDAVHLIGRTGESKVIYDITDDWTKFSHFTDRPALLALTIAQDRRLCRKADHVIVCSKSLYESRKPIARSIHLIPNGVDAAHYATVLNSTGPLPPDAGPAAWPRPVFGYTGSIHGDRVDINLVEAIAQLLIARHLPGTLVLLGPNMLSTANSQRLLATGRVVLPGPRPYRDLPQYMRAFDVCMTPHCMTEFVESLNPIKLWEYLAAGKPIVSTDVAGFRDFPDVVRLAKTPEEFLTQLQAALAEGTSKAARRQATAATHTWQARVDKIVPLLS